VSAESSTGLPWPSASRSSRRKIALRPRSPMSSVYLSWNFYAVSLSSGVVGTRRHHRHQTSDDPPI
jgi:hypothetical protein